MQLWGGIECTVNRVRELYFDQNERTGHAQRLDDLDLIADLGIRTLRYPVLWERHAPDDLSQADFSWADQRLNHLRHLDITPIAGLVHHGSGPRHTSLVDPQFPEKLAQYAATVARRYPWLEYFTPVNEPLTTGRFAGLYGHWYPHGTDNLTFLRCLLTQVKAVVLAMRAIREIIPHAKLVQTEDLAKVFSTEPLRYQADFENERRFATFDLLAGELTPDRPFYGFMRWADIPAEELDWFRANPCPPDIQGVNYYITSERFLDHRYAQYPEAFWAGNGRDKYVDVAACHVRAQGAAGLLPLLSDLWARHRRPIAVTEAHLGCTREEQVRWLTEIWDGAQTARRSGVDVRAVTAWCMFGAYNWNTLVTRDENFYEPGVFDIRGPRPRPTALAHVCRQLAAGDPARHPVTDTPGWWRRPTRLLFPVTHADPVDEPVSLPSFYRKIRTERPILITNAGDPLAHALVAACKLRGLAYVTLEFPAAEDLRPVLDHYKPWAVLNVTGHRFAHAASCPPFDTAHAQGLAGLAELCAVRGTRLVTFSSDLVFSGFATKPYVETDVVDPVCQQTQNLAEAERLALGCGGKVLVVRTGPLFDLTQTDLPRIRHLASAAAGPAAAQCHHAASSHVVSPTYVPDLVNTVMDLLIDDATGLWHLANVGHVTWGDFVHQLAPFWTGPVPGFDEPVRFHALASTRHRIMPTLDDALDRALHGARVQMEGRGECRQNPAEAGVETNVAG